MAHVKTYFLMPNFDFQPGGKIALGNIIADPFRPQRVLTAPPSPPTDQQVQETVQHDYRNLRKEGGGVNMSVWVQLLQTIGLKLGSEYDKSTTTEYSMDSLKTIQYRTEPTEDEITARIKDKKIENIMQPNRYRSNPVYMIIAIKVAEKLSVSVGKDTQKSGVVEGSVPVSESVTAGANLSMSRQNEHQESFRMEKDVVFAYQLLEIRLKGWREKTLNFDEFKDNAAFLGDDSEEEEESETNVELNVATAKTIQQEASSLKETELSDGRENFMFVSLEH